MQVGGNWGQTITEFLSNSNLEASPIFQKIPKTKFSSQFFQVVHSRRESDAGVYWCEARNELGVARSRNATLQVSGEFCVAPRHIYASGTLGWPAVSQCRKMCVLRDFLVNRSLGFSKELLSDWIEMKIGIDGREVGRVLTDVLSWNFWLDSWNFEQLGDVLANDE